MFDVVYKQWTAYEERSRDGVQTCALPISSTRAASYISDSVGLMVDAPAAPSRSISSALIASCSGAGRWRYNVATDTPIVGAISRADMPDTRSFRAASIRFGVMPF